MIWANFLKIIPALGTYSVQFSRTTDGGGTWSPPVLVSDPGPFRSIRPPDPRPTKRNAIGDLRRGDFETGLAELRVARSLDEGRTWLPAVVAGSIPLPPTKSIDPETGEQLPQPGYPTSAVAPDGTVYVAFENSPPPVRARSACSAPATAVSPGTAQRCPA